VSDNEVMTFGCDSYDELQVSLRECASRTRLVLYVMIGLRYDVQ